MTAIAEDVLESERQKAERGGEDAIKHLGAHDCALIWERVMKYAGEGYPFSSDNIQFSLPTTVTDRLKVVPNAIGAIFQKAIKRGMIERTGKQVPTLRKGGRGRMIPQYRGVKK